ncbi:tight adherence pilus pseudopilin TadF [Helicobacter cappadocius]|uniref:Tight adherence pilus pseudopilin TadF n=1 Tax=Helicobacter cappadocius TaxID=3063998 RepID=A0AA90PJ29_9HELI|nr:MULTISPECIES: tight adherence pilus pseudopilin TadF [unclassified Helicobacter]MDO7253118.1 tight adherence pilus pseudopilin TadF [Helicobacter sp. faydin-H75]MDP2538756.1 tight adherence pilus pseudopilin TadF [Helicobacter sp. faydin-H76]
MKTIKANFIYHDKGSVSIEASIIFGLLIILIVLIADIGKALINQGKMDRLSYAMASIIREKSLFQDTQELTPEHALSIYKILQNMSKDFLPKDSSVSLKLEAMYFSPNTLNSPKIQKILTYDFGDFNCTLANNFEENANLSVQASHKRYLPLYRATTCMEQKNSFSPILNLVEKIIKIQSSSIVLER